MEHGKRHNSYISFEKQNVFCGRSRLWLNRFIKENIGLAYTTIGGLCSALLGAFFWFIIASILDVNNYGLLNYYIALASIFAALGTIGLDTTITTYLAKGEEEILYEANFLTFHLRVTISAYPINLPLGLRSPLSGYNFLHHDAG